MHRFHRLSHRSGRLAALFLVLVSGSGPAVLASSHREAPFITQRPQADNTDAYAFRSFEPGREDFLVAIANFNPLEEPYGGPIYYPSAAGTRYEIHIDASGNGLADFTFTVEFMPSFSSHTVTTDDGTEVESPLTYNHPNQITGVFDSNNAVLQPYTLSITSAAGTNPAVNVTHSSTAFFKPFDNIGTDVFPDYPFYSDSHVSDFDESFGSGLLGRVFFGARRDPYVESAAVSRFESPTLPESNIFGGHNVLSLALELPINVLTGDGANPVLGVWASTSMRKTRVLNESPTGPETMTEPPAPTDPWVQVSRLGMPNTNRLHIGLRSKDLFNARHPSTDPAEIAAALEWSALAEFWGWPSANRQDLVDLRLHGLPGVNQNGGVGDMLRIDTNVPPTPPAQQDRLGLLGSPPDPAGFPNGRRPGDDVVDIELKYLQGVLIGEPGPFDATDGADTDPTRYVSFPFLHVPFSRDDETLCVILTSSTSPDPSSFTTVQEAYVDSTDPNRIGTPMTADPLVFYLLDTEVDAFIQSVERNASVLEFVVGPGGSS